jgi:thiamine-monophosphate kinase
VTPDSAYLVSRYRIPEPRLSIGQHLRGIARACADISDGLVADLGHLCRASGVGAELNVHDVPVSDAAGRCLEAGEASIEALVTGGDDYELVFAAGSSRRRSVAQLAETCGIRLTRVGRITEGQGVSVHDADGEMLKIVRPGFTHF